MCADNCAGTITPDSRLDDVFRSFPELEETVAELSTSFAALKTAALRKTVAKTTTLSQLAQADETSISTLIDRLREAAGQESAAAGEPGAAGPDWANTDLAARCLDARQIIEQGGHPLDRVMQGVEEIKSGEVYELITPFVPTPLIELVKQRGFEAHCTTVGPSECRTYFRRN
jgi:uncharacterized protein (DUF2249 family)